VTSGAGASRRGSRPWCRHRRRGSARVARLVAAEAVGRRVVHAAAPEHERVHAHTHVRTLGLDALPDEHAGAVDVRLARHSTRLRADLVACQTMHFALFVHFALRSLLIASSL
jgi:hypothetical protein